MRRVVWGLLALVVGCASPPPPPVVQPLWKDGVMQKPLTVKEAERYLQQASPEFSVCYRREQMNLAKTSDYVFQVFIPVDGSTPDVTVLKETVPGQLTLRDCLTQAMERVHFPAHVGEPLTLKVPIEGG